MNKEFVKGMQVRYGTDDIEILESVYLNNIYGINFSTKRGLMVDMGAHIGSFAALCFANGVQKYFGVEALPENFTLLEKNVRLLHSKCDFPIDISLDNKLITNGSSSFAKFLVNEENTSSFLEVTQQGKNIFENWIGETSFKDIIARQLARHKIIDCLKINMGEQSRMNFAILLIDGVKDMNSMNGIESICAVINNQKQLDLAEAAISFLGFQWRTIDGPKGLKIFQGCKRDIDFSTKFNIE